MKILNGLDKGHRTRERNRTTITIAAGKPTGFKLWSNWIILVHVIRTIKAIVTVLRLFFKVTLDRPETTRHLVLVCEPRKLQRVLPPEEVPRHRKMR
jgi:hypothetical protein